MAGERGRGGRPVERRAPEGTFAFVLCSARERAGIDRAEMARRLGVAPPQITRWESGDVDIGENVVRRYAAALRQAVRLELEDPDARA